MVDIKYTKPYVALPPEFYRASEHVMNGGVLWSPEYSTTGVKGSRAIDFYLELTRDGDQLPTHYSRFQPGRNYHR